MLKLLLLLGCINLLVIASTNTNVFQHSAGAHKKASLDSKLGLNKTDDSVVPLMFVETKSGQIKNVGSVNDYSCPDGYTFLTFNDDANNLIDICKQLSGSGVSYRLMSGGSATSPSFVQALSTDNNQTYRCDSLESGVVALDQAACVKTQILDTQLAEGDGNCPKGYDLIVNEEVKANQKTLCNQLDKWGIYRIGLRGSLSGPGYNCEEKDFDDRVTGGSICVKRQITDLKVVDTLEKTLCGQGKRPVNAEEALANRKAICGLLGQWDIVRIGGGGSFDGPGYGCGLRELDRRGVGGILCAPEKTAQ